MGLLGEMMIRTYHESQGKPIYTVREVVAGAGERGSRGAGSRRGRGAGEPACRTGNGASFFWLIFAPSLRPSFDVAQGKLRAKNFMASSSFPLPTYALGYSGQ